MSFILRLFTCGLLLTSIGFSQSKDPTALELSAFEQFVSQPGTRHTRSKAVGTIESAESKTGKRALPPVSARACSCRPCGKACIFLSHHAAR